MGIATPTPFVAAAVVTALAMAAFAVALLRRGVPDQDYDDPKPPGETLGALREAVADEPRSRRSSPPTRSGSSRSRR